MSTGTRARSRSLSSKAVSRHDGINLYAPAPISERYNQMVESGRQQAAEFFENPTRAENVRNDVAHESVVTKGDTELDKFRVTAQSPKGFSTDEQQKIQRYAGHVPFEHGATARTLFVYVPHSRYDSRVLGFEFAPKDWMMVLLALLIVAGTIYGAMSLTSMQAINIF